MYINKNTTNQVHVKTHKQAKYTLIYNTHVNKPRNSLPGLYDVQGNTDTQRHALPDTFSEIE